jgi:hypothetical protein
VKYPIVGLKYISKNSAEMDWDFIVRVLSCVWTSDHRCIVVYEWAEDDEVTMSVGMCNVKYFNDNFDRYREI